MKTFLEKNLGYFGHSYELKVLKQLIGSREKINDRFIRESQFGKNVIRKIQANHFDNEIAKDIVKNIKRYYDKHGSIPYYDTLETLLKSNVVDDLQLELSLKYLDEIKTSDDSDSDYIKENCKNFINTKNLYIEANKILRAIDSGQYNEYKKMAQQLSDVIMEINDEDELVAMTAGDHSDMEEGERHPIPTGIKPLDEDTNGGLALGELALVIAALKVGKTTLGSILANNAAMLGYNVLQVFFEDTTSQVKMKHRSKFTSQHLGFVANKKNKKMVAKKSDEKLIKMKENGGCLVVHKLDSTESYVSDVEDLIKKASERGVWFGDEEKFKKIKFHIVIIDYLECMNPKGKYDSEWGGEKEILRDIEKMCSLKKGYGFACWVFTQGGRTSLNKKVVTVEDMGGNLKKAQIAHFLASISKTLEQRALNQGTFAILGSRIGRDGIIYNDCTFDNGNMVIELTKESNISEMTTNDAYAKI